MLLLIFLWLHVSNLPIQTCTIGIAWIKTHGMIKRKTGLRVLLIGIVIACLSFLIFSNPETGGSRILAEVMNCGHFALFGVIAVALFFFFELGTARGLKNYSIAEVITAALGLLTEVLQLFDPGRSFELRDLAYDIMGGSTFLALTYSFRTSNSRVGRIIRLVAALICLASTTPIWMVVAEWYDMRRVFPLISSFETPRDVSRWGVHDAVLMQTRVHVTHGAYSAKVTLSPGEYPGLNSDYFIGDWHGYQTLTCDIFLAGDIPLRLIIRINDKEHNQAYADRYNHTFTLQPGPNVISIPLRDIDRAPHGRAMDMRAIALICLFAYRLDTPRTFFIDAFRLS